MKVIALTAFLLAACLALASAGPNPFRAVAKAVQQDEENDNKWHWSWDKKHMKEPVQIEAQSADMKAQDHYSNEVELTYYKPGKTVYLYGKAPATGSFNIDIVPQYADGYAQNVIALRMTANFDTYKFTRNSMMNGAWGYEESDGYLPLYPHQYFTITVTLQHYGYEIGVNGYRYASFYHRVPYTKNMKCTISEEAYMGNAEYY